MPQTAREGRTSTKEMLCQLVWCEPNSYSATEGAYSLFLVECLAWCCRSRMQPCPAQQVQTESKRGRLVVVGRRPAVLRCWHRLPCFCSCSIILNVTFGHCVRAAPSWMLTTKCTVSANRPCETSAVVVENAVCVCCHVRAGVWAAGHAGAGGGSTRQAGAHAGGNACRRLPCRLHPTRRHAPAGGAHDKIITAQQRLQDF